jgi:hypothetical protein
MLASALLMNAARHCGRRLPAKERLAVNEVLQISWDKIDWKAEEVFRCLHPISGP